MVHWDTIYLYQKILLLQFGFFNWSAHSSHMNCLGLKCCWVQFSSNTYDIFRWLFTVEGNFEFRERDRGLKCPIWQVNIRSPGKMKGGTGMSHLCLNWRMLTINILYLSDVCHLAVTMLSVPAIWILQFRLRARFHNCGVIKCWRTKLTFVSEVNTEKS